MYPVTFLQHLTTLCGTVRQTSDAPGHPISPAQAARRPITHRGGGGTGRFREEHAAAAPLQRWAALALSAQPQRADSPRRHGAGQRTRASGAHTQHATADRLN